VVFQSLLVFWIGISPVFAQEGPCDLAVAEAEKRLMEASADAEAWLALAESHRCAENFHSALAAYERALSLGATRALVAERVESLTEARKEAYFRVPPPQPCIAKKDVALVIQSATEGFQSCFSEVGPQRQGELNVSFDVVSSGGVQDLVVATEDLESEEGFETEVLLSCVEEKVLALSFPVKSGKDPVPVSFPLRLKPTEDSSEPVEDPDATPP